MSTKEMECLMKKILSSLLLTLILVTPVHAFDSTKEYFFHGEKFDLSKAPFEFKRLFDKDLGTTFRILDWIPEEVPRNVSIYVDLDGDNKADIIFANPLLQVLDYEFCNESEAKQGLLKCQTIQIHSDLIKFVPYPSPKVYIVFKEWFLYRYIIDGKSTDWSSGLHEDKRIANTEWLEQHLKNLRELGRP